MDDVVVTCDDSTTTVDLNPETCADGVTFADNRFAPAWSDGFITGGPEPLADTGDVVTAEVVGGGNTGDASDPYLELLITNRGKSRIHTYALCPTATWNPSTQGTSTTSRSPMTSACAPSPALSSPRARRAQCSRARVAIRSS